MTLPVYNPDLPAKVIEVKPRTGRLYEIPAYGFLEQIEIRFADPIPNMDAGNPYRLLIDYLPDDAPFQVFAKVRNV